MSDIHFRKTEKSVIEALLATCVEMRPDLTVISGDLTQRATIREFEEARTFLEHLGTSNLKILAIPGNHDIRPLYTPIKRIRDAYDRYTNFIAPLVLTDFVNADIAIRGINTVRATRLKDGHVSLPDVVMASKWFTHQPKEIVRILVTHHPLDLPIEFSKRKLARQAERGITEFAKVHVDVYLSGHFHRSSAVSTRHRYGTEQHGAIAVQAGTVSTRHRGELQSFNLLRIERARIGILPHLWDRAQKDFLPTQSLDFSFQDTHWVRI